MVTVRLLLLILTLGAAFVLTGCGTDESPDDGDARTSLDGARDDVRSASDTLVPGLGAALETEVRGSSAGYRRCGSEPSPSGARYLGTTTFEPSYVDAATAVDGVSALLREDGWTLDEAPDPEGMPDGVTDGGLLVLEASREQLTVTVRVAPAAVEAAVSSVCVDSSADIARDYADRPVED